MVSRVLQGISEVIKRGMRILLISPQLFLALGVTILAGEEGRVICCRYKSGYIFKSGFYHLIEEERLTFVETPPDELNSVGYPLKAPYDLILTPWPNCGPQMMSQLAPKGRIFNFMAEQFIERPNNKIAKG